jgi:hypothetical protein
MEHRSLHSAPVKPAFGPPREKTAPACASWVRGRALAAADRGERELRQAFKEKDYFFSGVGVAGAFVWFDQT